MSLFGRLFGGGSRPAAETPPEMHDGYEIVAQPIPEGGKFRVGATIRKDGREHRLIRADVLDTEAGARDASVRKARQLIDQQGERLFD